MLEHCANLRRDRKQPMVSLAQRQKWARLDPRLTFENFQVTPANQAAIETLFLKPREAVDAFSTALLLVPDNVDLWCSLGDAYRRLKLHDLALAGYREAIRLIPDRAEAWIGLGHAYRNANQLERSAQAYRTAAKLDAQPDRAWMLIATVDGNSTRH